MELDINPWAPFVTMVAQGVVGTIIPLILLLAAGRIWLIPKVKGKSGETMLALRLRSLGFSALHNIIVRVPGEGLYSGPTQIDHVVLTAQGLLVIETKNYGGAIYGQAHEAQWVQTMGRTKSRFQNPLRQNYRHARALSTLLQEPVQGLVVFVGAARFPKGLPVGIVTTFGELGARLRSMGQPSPAALQGKTWSKLKVHATENAKLRSAHIASLRARRSNDKRGPFAAALAALAAALLIAFHL